MTRQPLRFASNEDRRTYRKCMRTLAFVYGSIIVLAIGATSLRVHPTSNVVDATANTVSVATLNQIDR